MTSATLLLDLLVKATLVLAAAAGMAWNLRRNPASAHRIWVIALVGLLLLPVLGSVLPALHIPLALRWTGDSEVTANTGAFTIASAAAPKPVRDIDWIALVWLGGALLALLPQLTGSLAVKRIVRRSTLADRASRQVLEQVAGELGFSGRVRLLFAEREIVPMVWNARHPIVLLPVSARTWPAAKQHAVLLHEISHIARGDLWTQWLSQAVTSVYWFHPLAWFAAREARLYSEMACDERVLHAGVKASEYASQLLDIARLRPSASAGLAMASRSHLEGRVRAILQTPEPRPKARAIQAVLFCAAVVPISAMQFGGAAKSGAALTGNVYDPSGARVPSAVVRLLGRSGTSEVRTAGDGSFSFEGVGPGEYHLIAAKPGFALQSDRVNVTAGGPFRGDIHLRIGRVQERLTVAGNPGPLRIGGQTQAAKLVFKSQPVYPRSAKIARIQGDVLLSARIAKDGSISELAVESSPDQALSESALEAVRQWRYRPTLLNGDPVEVATTIEVHYTLLQ